jgi:hypothetical protein
MPLVQTSYSNQYSAKFDKEIKAKIYRLISEGNAYGNWKKQAGI